MKIKLYGYKKDKGEEVFIGIFKNQNAAHMAIKKFSYSSYFFYKIKD